MSLIKDSPIASLQATLPYINFGYFIGILMPGQNLPYSLFYPFSEKPFLCACLSSCCFSFSGDTNPYLICVCSSESPDISLYYPWSLSYLHILASEPSLSAASLSQGLSLVSTSDIQATKHVTLLYSRIACFQYITRTSSELLLWNYFQKSVEPYF